MNGFDRDRLGQLLGDGIRELGVSVSQDRQRQLLDYLTLLHKWNRSFNLSGIREPEAMVRRHLLDSLAILPFIRAGTLLDVGTGAGLPGIPLAICAPENQYILLDSNGKKTRFLFQTVNSLGLENTEVVNERIENFQSSRQIDIVLTRAFASLAQTVAWIDHLLSPTGALLAMKGTFPAEELQALPPGYQLTEAHELHVPGEPGERQLLRIART